MSIMAPDVSQICEDKKDEIKGNTRCQINQYNKSQESIEKEITQRSSDTEEKGSELYLIYETNY